MKYIIYCTVKELCKHPWKNAILFMSLLLGSVLPTLFLGTMNRSVKSAELYKDSVEMSNVISVFSGSSLTKDEHNKVIQDYMEKVDGVSKVGCDLASEEMIIRYKNKFIHNVYLRYINKDYAFIYKEGCKLQRQFQLNDGQCAIGREIANEIGIAIGNEIKIGSKTYIVHSIIDLENSMHDIYIPYDNDAKTMYGSYYLFCSDDPKTIISKVTELIAVHTSHYNVVLGKEEYNDEIKNIYSFDFWKDIIIICFISILYGLINFINIEKFYFNSRKSNYGVLLAYGISNRSLFVKLYTMYGSIFVLVNIVSVLFCKILEKQSIGIILMTNISGMVIVVEFICGVVVALLISLIRIRSLTKKPVAEIIKVNQ